MAIQFRVLGPLEVLADGEPVKLGGAKQQSVLGALLLEPNRVVSVERLIDWVWGDELPERNATLQVYVSNLRRALAPHAEPAGRSYVVTRRPGYAIELGAEELDSLEFADLRAAAEASMAEGSLDRAAELLRRGLALWRGVPLAGLPMDAGTGGEMARLEVARTTAIEQLARTELERGRHQQVVDELRGWVSDHPLDEQLRASLMLALYRCGRQAEALATYREGRELLLDQLGIDPSKELRDLEGRMLNQDPALDLVGDGAGRSGPVDGTVLRSSVVTRTAHLRVGGSTHALSRTVTTIGRLPDRDIVLDDPSVSRSHAEIRSTPDGHVLVDAGSANGTQVRGRRVREHWLQPDDEILIGETTLVFELGPAGDAAQP